jgi:hypothetical protein
LPGSSAMNWTHFFLATLAAGIVSIFSDWLFMGSAPAHASYAKLPDPWRPNPPSGEGKRIAISSVWTFVTCAVFIYVCARLGISSYRGTLKLALAFWVAGPLSLIAYNHLFMKMLPQVSAAYAINWAVRLGLAALAVVWILK